MQLYYQCYPNSDGDNTEPAIDSRPPLLIIPGLFGSTTNWRSVAKRLGNDYPVWVIDQRNHGRSPQAPSNTYTDMCEDLVAFMDHHGLISIILCGHSMGGKVAMLFALLYPERVTALIVLDIAPVAYNHSHAPFLEELMSIDLSSLKSRSEADRALQAVIPETGTRLFLLQNLAGTSGQYYWRINLAVLHQYMDHMIGFPMALVENSQFLNEVLVIVGEESDYVKAADHSIVLKLFEKARFASISGAGHWLHADQPDAVIDSVSSFLSDL